MLGRRQRVRFLSGGTGTDSPASPPASPSPPVKTYCQGPRISFSRRKWSRLAGATRATAATGGHDSLAIVDKKPPWTRWRHPQNACVWLTQRVRVSRVAPASPWVGRPMSELRRSKVDNSFTPWRTRWQTLTTVSHSGDPEARSRRQFSIFGDPGGQRWQIDESFTPRRYGSQKSATV